MQKRKSMANNDKHSFNLADLTPLVNALVKQGEVIKEYEAFMEHLFFMLCGDVERKCLKYDLHLSSEVYKKLHTILKEYYGKRENDA